MNCLKPIKKFKQNQFLIYFAKQSAVSHWIGSLGMVLSGMDLMELHARLLNPATVQDRILKAWDLVVQKPSKTASIKDSRTCGVICCCAAQRGFEQLNLKWKLIGLQENQNF